MFQLESPIMQSQQMCDHRPYSLEALDHDWSVAGVAPSVVLMTGIPNAAKESF